MSRRTYYSKPSMGHTAEGSWKEEYSVREWGGVSTAIFTRLAVKGTESNRVGAITGNPSKLRERVAPALTPLRRPACCC